MTEIVGSGGGIEDALGIRANTWTAEALRVAGLPVSTSGVVFADQVLDQLPPLLEPVTNTQSRY